MKSGILKIWENPSAKLPRHSGEQDVFLYTKIVFPFSRVIHSGSCFAAELAPLFNWKLLNDGTQKSQT
jgi:hypothetical protein